jgi:hypothetical protein
VAAAADSWQGTWSFHKVSAESSAGGSSSGLVARTGEQRVVTGGRLQLGVSVENIVIPGGRLLEIPPSSRDLLAGQPDPGDGAEEGDR